MVLVAFIGWAGWDYWRVSQIYLSPAARHPAYQEDTIAKVRSTVWFRDPVEFADLTLTPLSRDNAAQIARQADALLVYSPEVRVIEKRIEAATLLNDDVTAVFHLARYQAAFPDAYARWAARHLDLARINAPPTVQPASR